MAGNNILKISVFLGVLILLLVIGVRFYSVLATTVGPAQTPDYAVTNSAVAKRLLPTPVNATIQVQVGKNTTNTGQVSLQENTTYTEKASKGHPLKGNTRSLEKFELLMEQARKQHIKTIADLKRINAEIIYQEEKSAQIKADKLGVAQSWSYKINQLASLQENQTKQQVKVDLNQLKNLHPNVILGVEAIVNKTTGYNWEENQNKKWVELLDRAEQIKKMVEEMEKRFEEKVSTLHYVGYQ